MVVMRAASLGSQIYKKKKKIGQAQPSLDRRGSLQPTQKPAYSHALHTGAEPTAILPFKVQTGSWGETPPCRQGGDSGHTLQILAIQYAQGQARVRKVRHLCPRTGEDGLSQDYGRETKQNTKQMLRQTVT